MVKSVLIAKNNTEINQNYYLMYLYIKSFLYLFSKDLSFFSFFTFQRLYNADKAIPKKANNNIIGKNLIIKLIRFAHRVNNGVHIHSANAVSLNINVLQLAYCKTFIGIYKM